MSVNTGIMTYTKIHEIDIERYKNQLGIPAFGLRIVETRMWQAAYPRQDIKLDLTAQKLTQRNRWRRSDMG